MIAQINMLRSKTGDKAHFRTHFQGTHADLTAALPGLVGHEVNHITKDLPKFNRGPYSFDGMEVLTFPDLETLRAALLSEAQRKVSENLPTFAGPVSSFTVRKFPLQVCEDANAV